MIVFNNIYSAVITVFSNGAPNADAGFDITWGGLADWFLKTALPILIIILVSVIAYYAAAYFIKRMVRGFIRRRAAAGSTEDGEMHKRMVTLGSFINSVVLAVIIVIALIAVLSKLGVNVVSIVGGLGIAALGISLAMQNMIKDFINGFFIMADEYYRIGDTVTIAGRTGVVEKIDLRKTVLRDLSGVVHIIPNSAVDVASNATRGFSRLNLDISVSYSEDLVKAINIINEVCASLAKDTHWKKKLVGTPHVLRINNLADYGVEIKIVGDTKAGAQDAVMGELRLRLKNEFDKQHIEIPYPTHKIYFGNKLS